ncbi:MAG TPA: hypothetical protein VF669_08725 [Tepidisphaeraceae bacterium]|jgi:hypothetical protein
MKSTPASADAVTMRRAFWALALVAPFGGCGRTAVVVDNPPPNTQTIVTVEHRPQTQPSDKNLVIRNKS